MNKRLYIDHIEEDYVVCEDDQLKKYYLNVEDFPDGIREGDVIKINENGEKKIDEDKKKERRGIIMGLEEKVFKRGNIKE